MLPASRLRLLIAALGLAAATSLRASPPPYLTTPADESTDVVRERAGRALQLPIRTVVDKPRPSPSGDMHDYVSYATYWWPDPRWPDGLPFVRHDGHHDRAMTALGDEARLGAMEEAVRSLALGWAVLHRPEYADRAGQWLRAWFLDPATRMTPNLVYAQIRRGHDGDKNVGTGCLDGRGLTQVVDGLGLLEGSPALTAAEAHAIHDWFQAYFDWLMTSQPGMAEHLAANNHGSWYLVQAVSIARYLGDDETARRLCSEDYGRIAWQIRPDGSQPLELARQDALGYSVFNISAQLQVARLALPLGIDLTGYQAPGGGSLAKAIAYLKPYNADPKRWPGRQISPQHPGFLGPIERAFSALRAQAAQSSRMLPDASAS